MDEPLGTPARPVMDEPLGTPDRPVMDEPLVMFLEADQLVGDKARPLPRVRLSKPASVALWALRVFVLVVSAMVIYTFFAQLAS